MNLPSKHGENPLNLTEEQDYRMDPQNIFDMVKSYHRVALQSFQTLQAQNERMISFFLEQAKKENLKLDQNYQEWLSNTKKAFDDYQTMILKGLDYLANCFERNGHEKARKPADEPTDQQADKPKR
jgi:hypothetical protein